MSSTIISTYNAPVLTERCGEVYCSQDLNTFFINCLKCLHQFNFPSCDIFVKHIRECLPPLRNAQAQENPPKQEIHSFVSNYTIKDDPEQANHQIDPLMTIKEEDVEVKEEVNNIVHTPGDEEYMSECQNEDDLPLNSLGHRNLLEDIIIEYKKHPILWDTKLAAKREDKVRAYKKIRKAVNLKYKMNLSYVELRTKILNLRSTYRRVSKEKKAHEKLGPDGTETFKPMLWYFDKISFIDETDEMDLNSDAESDHEGEDVDGNESSDSNGDSTDRESKKAKRPITKILSEPDIISEIIRQYKEFPFLWDQTSPLYNDRDAKSEAIRKITESINRKFHKNVTDGELRRQISNFKSTYRKVQREKHKPNYQVRLWYYDQLSFIDNKANLVDQPIKHEADLDITETYPDANRSMDCDENYEMLNHEGNSEGDDEGKCDAAGCNDEHANLLSSKKINNPIILSLIEEYKKHPYLWDYQHKTIGRLKGYDAAMEITCAVNAKHKTTFTRSEIRNKLEQLRRSYILVLRKKEAFEKKRGNATRKFMTNLWFFDKIAFVGAKDSQRLIDGKKKRREGYDKTTSAENKSIPVEELHSECSVIRSEEVEDSAIEPQEASLGQTSITQNKTLLAAVLEEYKTRPCLLEDSSNQISRKKNLTEVCDVINQKFNTNLNYLDLDREMTELLSSRRNVSGSSEDSQWLSSLTYNAESNKSCQDKSEDHMDFQGVESHEIGDNCRGDDEIFQNASPVNTKEIVFRLIELYKEATILWDIHHPDYKRRTVRKKCVETILDKLRQEHDCELTIEEFRYQVRFLQNAYFRALRQEIAAKQANVSDATFKPFFFEKMSFLQTCAKKNLATAPNLQIPKGQPQEFAFLCENRPLMLRFIELYKTHCCLWDHKHKDRRNLSAHSVAYSEIVNMFQQHGEDFTEERVRSAIGYLQSTVANTQKALLNNEKEPPVWFYEHLKFLGKISRIQKRYCTHCNQHFRSLAEFEKHKIEIVGDYPYKCDVCNAGFVSRSKYAYHQITHKEPHKCDQCDFQAFDKYNFNVHMRRHKGIYPFRCEVCDKRMATSTELNRHLRTHTGERPYICEICGKALVAKVGYDEHMKRHRNQRDHKCEICDGAFYTADALKGHMATHSSDRQHACETCGKAFKSRKTLVQHRALHVEKKKYECNICGKLFAQQAGVYSHMKSHGQTIS